MSFYVGGAHWTLTISLKFANSWRTFFFLCINFKIGSTCFRKLPQFNKKCHFPPSNEVKTIFARKKYRGEIQTLSSFKFQSWKKSWGGKMISTFSYKVFSFKIVCITSYKEYLNCTAHLHLFLFKTKLSISC